MERMVCHFSSNPLRYLHPLMPLICWLSLLLGFALLGGGSSSLLQIQTGAEPAACSTPYFELSTERYQWRFQIGFGRDRRLCYYRSADWPLPLARLLQQLSGRRTADSGRTVCVVLVSTPVGTAHGRRNFS